MKTIFIPILFAAFAIHLQAQTTDTISTRGCNNETPKFGNDLGTITHGKEIKLGGKIWSAPVTAANCQKTKFDGGPLPNRRNPSTFNADCRTNPGFEGSLFSWCAVVRFADELCPHPWRVPTQQDFQDLMKAICGAYYIKGHDPGITEKELLKCSNLFFHQRGTRTFITSCDERGGIIDPIAEMRAHPHTSPGVVAEISNNGFSWSYWSQSESERDATGAWIFGSLRYHYVGLDLNRKNMGTSLRCLKDE
jgi:uncharacterized protein (TIGR02145 family)